MSDDPLDYVGSKKLAWGMIALIVVTFVGAVPVIHWKGPVTFKQGSEFQFVFVTRSDCGINNGRVFLTDPNSSMVVCEIVFNYTEKDYDTGIVSFWYCLKYGGCW